MNMSYEELIKDLILALSGLTIGLSAVSVWGTFKRALTRRVKTAWALISTGVMIRIGLITVLVFASPPSPVTWMSYVYMLGLATTSVGFAMLLKRDDSTASGEDQRSHE